MIVRSSRALIVLEAANPSISLELRLLFKIALSLPLFDGYDDSAEIRGRVVPIYCVLDVCVGLTRGLLLLQPNNSWPTSSHVACASHPCIFERCTPYGKVSMIDALRSPVALTWSLLCPPLDKRANLQ